MDIIDKLQNEFGRSLTAKELAQLLRVDPCTINKHAHLWGGIEVSPNQYRFFEKMVVEIIENANRFKPEGQALLPGKDNGTKKPILETFPLETIEKQMALLLEAFGLGDTSPRRRIDLRDRARAKVIQIKEALDGRPDD